MLTSTLTESELLAALRQGDELAFEALVTRYHQLLVRLARAYVHDEATAEDVTQEAWARALRALPQFEGRSSLKTWLSRILINTAKTRAQRDGRQVSFSDLELDSDEPAIESERFQPADSGHAPGHWVKGLRPSQWASDSLDEQVTQREILRRIGDTIASLPELQRLVITFHDVEGWPTPEICNTLELSESNQRVLLHRARAKVRRAVERYFAEAQLT